MIIETLKGKELALEIDRWMYGTDSLCTIAEEQDQHYLLETTDGYRFPLKKSLIQSNRIPIKDGKVDIGEDLLDIYALKKRKEASSDRFNQLFSEYGAQLFLNKEQVLSKAEYYLLTSPIFSSGVAPGINMRYCIGAIIETLNPKSDLYFKELDGHKDLYVIRVGAMQSGRHTVSFWCADEERLIHYPMGEGILPCSPAGCFMSLQKQIRSALSLPVLDKQDQILEQFLSEIGIACS